MKLIDKIYEFLFEESVVVNYSEPKTVEEEKPVYISCSDLFIK